MGESPVKVDRLKVDRLKVGIVDIGSNSMRLLITDGFEEFERQVEVTGLGRGVDSTGVLSDRAVEDTLEVLRRFGGLLEAFGVQRRLAIATSASRDASNREAFFDGCETALGIRPTLITGSEEARFAFRGATSGLAVSGPVVVSDIGGGSTEFVWADREISIDIGSVRLTDRHLPARPASSTQVREALDAVHTLFDGVSPAGGETLVGVAGTWTSLAAMDQELAPYDPDLVHGYLIGRADLGRWIAKLAERTIEETAALAGLDPKRAPVILAGAVVALGVMDVLGADEATVSERDTLEGAAKHLLDLA